MNSKPKIAIYVSGGVVQGVLSNVSSDLEVELVDQDNAEAEGDKHAAERRWDDLQKDLPYGNY